MWYDLAHRSNRSLSSSVFGPTSIVLLSDKLNRMPFSIIFGNKNKTKTLTNMKDVIIQNFKLNFRVEREKKRRRVAVSKNTNNPNHTAFVCKKQRVLKFKSKAKRDSFFHTESNRIIPAAQKKSCKTKKLDTKFLCELIP